MENNKCKFCNREINNRGSLASHENCCKLNPNGIKKYRSPNAGAKKGLKRTYDIWNKGLTKENNVSLMACSEKKKEDYKNGILISHQKDKPRTNDEKKRISETMKLNTNAGGLRQGSGRGKKCWYFSKIAGDVFLDSTWELAYVKWLDENNINWKRNWIKFPYHREKMIRYYIPDFYLIDSDEFIEIKGFERPEDKLKWNEFPYKLTVLKFNELKQLGIVVNK